VLSLQTAAAPANFDFRDIFNEGYAFDDIGATLRIARGVVYSETSGCAGRPPSQYVGAADLKPGNRALRVKVIPKLPNVGRGRRPARGPLAGVGALAAQKLLRDPFEEVVSQEYMVTGAWQAPDVKRLPKAKAETQVSEP